MRGRSPDGARPKQQAKTATGSVALGGGNRMVRIKLARVSSAHGSVALGRLTHERDSEMELPTGPGVRNCSE